MPLVPTVQGTQHLQLRSAEGIRNPWHATSLGKAPTATRTAERAPCGAAGSGRTVLATKRLSRHRS
ncbi:hypothetical protein ACFOOM_24005 [Streptomyces echinoruber]|uniref:hypothetical protein n=1 Tax=Streptomyces echinoruber TaxID=68898 RepID=UPI00167C6116|nr:hypothetical protein [Streptomyces echinoruber]